jgi:signal transduction histidine kinase
VIRAIELAGWVLAIGAITAAAVACHRMAGLSDNVARTCHELRGPLTAARLGLGLAFRSGQLGDLRLRALELELGRAALAVEDLSRVSTVAPTYPRLGRDEIDIAELLAESVEAWGAVASAHGAHLRLLASAGRPVVIGERLRLAQAIGNLVANAIEHGGGLIQISCRVDAGVVRIEVIDQGPGLPAPLTELVRGPRRRGAGSRRGHGLAVASAVVDAHGGRLAVVPSDRGAILVITLPSAVIGPPATRGDPVGQLESSSDVALDLVRHPG